MNVDISDIIAIPSRNELLTITRAAQLFGRFIKLYSYHNSTEDRLDVWFRRSTETDEELCIGNESAISTFRYAKKSTGEEVFGPWVQIINLANLFLPVTIVHELAHLVDRYHRPPRTSWTSASQPFEALYQAYLNTTSCRILSSLSSGIFPFAVSPEGNVVTIFEEDEVIRKRITNIAKEMMKGHEVFARCLTAYVFYNSSELDMTSKDRKMYELFERRVQSFENAPFAVDLSYSDFLLVRAPLHSLLERLGWNNDA